MSHKINCGCVISDSKDRAVRKDKTTGYILKYCNLHSQRPSLDIAKLCERLRGNYNCLDVNMAAEVIEIMILNQRKSA